MFCESYYLFLLWFFSSNRSTAATVTRTPGTTTRVTILLVKVNNSDCDTKEATWGSLTLNELNNKLKHQVLSVHLLKKKKTQHPFRSVRPLSYLTVLESGAGVVFNMSCHFQCWFGGTGGKIKKQNKKGIAHSQYISVSVLIRNIFVFVCKLCSCFKVI